ncbi:hypothetical protein ACF2JD_10940 [Aeromonas sp. A-5]|uniref:hypothetical protein n=1 Tax=Aeromonas ichthyocola TaxID=3367746 RepID=UPI0038ECB36E
MDLHEAPLLDALGRLSQSDSGWILLIAPPGLPVAKQLQAQGINPVGTGGPQPQIKNWQLTPASLEWSLRSRLDLAACTGFALDRVKLSKLGNVSGC